MNALQTNVIWRKPAEDPFKDASFSASLNCVEFGMCTQDDKGNFVLAKTLWSNPIVSTDIGEAMGIYMAYIGCMNCNF